MADPYTVLGVPRTASDEEIRSAYRRLVKLHHPDHNGGSAEAARRFEAVQEAYGDIQRLRRTAGGRPPSGAPRGTSAPPRTARPRTARPRSTPTPDPDLDARLEDIERQVQEARRAREKAARTARKAAAQAAREAAARAKTDARERPTDEELGYIRTDDSFTKILDDAWDELTGRYEDARKSEHPAARRVNDLLNSLKDLGEKRGRRD